MIASYPDATILPPGDSSDLILVPASREERIETIKLNSAVWKGRFDVDTYIGREEHLHRQQLNKDGLTSWILVDRQEPAGQRTILSSCETYKKKAMLARDGQVDDVACHGVGSVYCRPEFRGKGYAKRMIQELSILLDKWQDNKAADRSQLSVLYSDIGKKFYARFGWRPFPSSHFEISPISRTEYEQDIPGANLPKARTLLAQDVQQYMCNDQILQKEREILRAASQKSHGAKVAIIPDFDHFKWHWAREEYCAERLCTDRDVPQIKGAGEENARVYCTWNRNFGSTPEENTLYILRWVYDEPTSPEETETTVRAMAAILRRAQFEANEWDMAKVEFWNPTPLLEKAVAILDPAAKVVHREESSIACLKLNGTKQGLDKDVEWFLNEKYAWC
ncbi:hypothetical protein EYZ11_008022 [Aspergillus tanneri]|uniref:N-acetyltransferase domain-containing protein n=1 Tax=Aspergillus tanneri TaxID=1220188 RepID=A0A4S3JH37_9EURO|nr:uncharacterized protein ATNIH1004_004137 [Aspergillus tanneri]KAA8648254.1 hypothetical protein ATNIH1004_004137 [Aspergillus tanneri]THC92511.1 hypothetical protein EYZ11_008022 [Aspergillus tanneri]